MKKWLVYTSILAFTAYWASNLLLWFPWSYSATLGITLMLSAAPLLWAYVTFLALRSYPGNKFLTGASLVALILLLLAVVMDYVFFGLIRGAMEDLYHPSTFYGYGFLLVWPFILSFAFKKKISKQKRSVKNADLLKTGIIGLSCFGLLVLIIVLRIEF